jgi:hypothetical protein
MKLSDDLKHWRAERPDEWTMDDFVRKALELEEENRKLRTDKMYADYLNNTKYEYKLGRHTISCNKGLFSVDAFTKEEAEKEAMYYFLQYFEDGEYK